VTEGAVMRRAQTATVAIAWAAFVLAVSVLTLTLPSFTSAVVVAIGVPSDAGLQRDEAVSLAEDVRFFVTSERAPELPSVHDGQEAFDEDAVEHLIDVREVLAGVRMLTGLMSAALAAWVAWSLSRRRRGALARGIEAGGWAVAGVAVGGLLLALLGFDSLFDAFHQVFFEPGSWLFPADSLLIRLFPEQFWMVAGVSWATLCLLGAVVLVYVGRRLRLRSGTEGAASG
jgi:integral membrane protein (TIGR01906 family)